MSFPFILNEERLEGRDFVRFEFQFLSSALELLPCTTVHFLPVTADSESAGTPERELPEVWKVGEKMVRAQLQPVVDPDRDLLFLPIWNGLTELAAVAVLSAGSKGLYRDFSAEWLMERSRLISREYRRIKHWSYDPVSGLLSGAHLHSELEVLFRLSSQPGQVESGLENEKGLHLLLIETGISASDADKTVGAISKVAAYLDSLVGGASVFHLGIGVFGLLWNVEDSNEISRFGYALLRKLKRQKISKAHVGVAPLFGAANAEGAPVERAERALSEVWRALAKARKRGVYAFCSAEELKRENHPFAPFSSEITAKLTAGVRRFHQYSLAVIEQDIVRGSIFPKRVLALIGDVGSVFDVGAGKVVVLLPELDEELAWTWASSLLTRIAALGDGSFSIGIASYPCPGFSKKEIPGNALKALYHTRFLGHGTITSFSGVSLNISGDVYYNEGDLVQAIKEYTLGLNLDPDNTNLLNSLGVIYAQLDKHKKAATLFEKALSFNPKDFMALVNLGFSLQAIGDTEGASRNFERALKIDDTYFDVLLQLGQQYCQEKRYRQAINVLEKAEKACDTETEGADRQPWERSEPWLHNGNGLGHGLVYAYLGEAFRAIGKNGDAMSYLQRAVRYNSRDARSLCLLAELYIKESQGADIALAFCDKAIEIDETKDSFWFCKGMIHHERVEFEAAREALLRALELNRKNTEALMLLATIYKKEKNLPLARTAYSRVLRLDGTHKRAANALKKLNK